ncbi:DNA binding domain-containing protein, excisionase family [Neorhodopirellula lusitana]|uniref:DNA binding domain-containing protein, excisionase family n=1 Tax=Neorhodopirellula lusitana TaxID=445327 RepID=A0ABY1Q7S1_9BACT|nr:helix-turn-helix domain-containing protein [Neorhodopirellula lusitana]SMP62147.1 DNA binding domain-containing protein, excisionase family [Neorhodopirellula lusitana]
MATYLSLEEAAKKLGIPTEKLIDLRSQGQVRGFRDGSSWKFPENEIDRLAEELPNLSGLGSGILAADSGGSGIGTVIGGDDSALSLGEPISGEDGSGSSLELGLEISQGDSGSGSDVNLVAGGSGIGSSIGSIASESPSSASEILDLDAIQLSDSAVLHDSGDLKLDDSGSGSSPSGDAGDDSDEFNLGSSLDLMGGSADLSLSEPKPQPGPSEASLSGLDIDLSSSGSADSGDLLSGESSEELNLGDDNKASSSLEMLDDLDLSDSASSIASGPGAVSGDVLSELDLLAGESIGSGLLSGDSENLIGSSLLGKDDGGSGVDDALADDDDLIIADDDDDLVVSSMGSDISIAGDSGINLMSPSDSGLSLESEPLDLAGSSISALDLGAELSEGSGSGSGSGSGFESGLIADDGGSAVDFQADEEFQLSPSGIQLEASDDSASQVIDIEDSESVDADVDFADASFEGDGAFDDQVAFDEVPAADGGFDDGMGDVVEADEAMEISEHEEVEVDTMSAGEPGSIGAPVAYEIPFTLLQTVGLLLILVIMSLGGMLMTDLVRNMWSYSELSAPVSSLTDMLIDVAGWGR